MIEHIPDNQRVLSLKSLGLSIKVLTLVLFRYLSLEEDAKLYNLQLNMQNKHRMGKNTKNAETKTTE